MVTLRDIAEQAGVTPTVVSSVVNGQVGNVRVSEAKRSMILSLIEKKGYVPNRSARSLSTQVNRCLGLIANQPRYGALDAYGRVGLFNLFSGMHKYCAPVGFHCVFSTADMQSGVAFDPPGFVRDRSVDGVALAGYLDYSVESRLAEFGINAVHIGTNASTNSKLPSISSGLDDALACIADQAAQSGMEALHLCLGVGPGADELSKNLKAHCAKLHSGFKIEVLTPKSSLPDVQELRAIGSRLADSCTARTVLISSMNYLSALEAGLSSSSQPWEFPAIVAVSQEGYENACIARTGLSVAQIIIPLEEIGQRVAKRLTDQMAGSDRQARPLFKRELVPCGFVPGASAPFLNELNTIEGRS